MSRIVVTFGAADGVVDVGGERTRVMVDGRECAMREEGLRGNLAWKGPKPVTNTLISSGDSISVSVLGEVAWGGSEGIVVAESLL
jgi:hypothetical protein